MNQEQENNKNPEGTKILSVDIEKEMRKSFLDYSHVGNRIQSPPRCAGRFKTGSPSDFIYHVR